MKKYRAIIPIVLIVLMVLSWYSLLSNSLKIEKQYNTYLKEARKFAENEITKYAIENYYKAIEVKNNPEIYIEVADYYKKIENNKSYLEWCETFMEQFPTNSKAYEYLLDAYVADEDYKSSFDILNIAQKRGISTEKIKKISKELEYVYSIDYNSYEDVGVYSNNFCATQNKEVWGYVNRFGEQRVGDKYIEAGEFTQSGFAPVVTRDEEAFFIDKTGAKVLASKEKYESFGNLVDEMISAKKGNGKYVYVNQEFKVLLEEYDYASTFCGGIAAVKNGNSWTLIGKDGKTISKDSYEDIKLDEKEIAMRNERAFVAKTEGKYVLVDEKGKQVGNNEFEDAKVFLSEAPAAVKIDGKWSFIKKDGKLLSEKKYDDARSFSNGLAAVCINGVWGFIDEKENIVIEPQFYDAKDFNEKGSCFVKTGEKWQLLKLYRLNR